MELRWETIPDGCLSNVVGWAVSVHRMKQAGKNGYVGRVYNFVTEHHIPFADSFAKIEQAIKDKLTELKLGDDE